MLTKPGGARAAPTDLARTRMIIAGRPIFVKVLKVLQNILYEEE